MVWYALEMTMVFIGMVCISLPFPCMVYIGNGMVCIANVMHRQWKWYALTTLWIDNGMHCLAIVWYALVWYGMTYHTIALCHMVHHSCNAWYDMHFFSIVWYALAMVWYGMVWHGMHCMVWYGMVCKGNDNGMH